MPGPSARDIRDLVIYREEGLRDHRAKWDLLAAIWHGQHKAQFPKEFRGKELPKVVGFIRRAWRGFGRMVGKVPDPYVTPLDFEKEADRASDIEKVLNGYHYVWSMKAKMEAAANFAVGMGALPMGVVPDPRSRYPALLVEDPRNAFPGPSYTNPGTTGWLAGWESPSSASGSLDDIIIRKRLSGAQLRSLYPNHIELQKIIPDTSQALRMTYPCLQYYDADRWISVFEDKTLELANTSHGAPHCPWEYLTNFAPDPPGGSSPAGDSDFFHQIALEISFMRLLDQKLALNDAVVWAWLVLTGHFEIDAERRTLKSWDPSAKAQMLSPPAEFQVDRDMAMMRDLMRTLNMETEATFGNITGGPITGRGIDRLNAGPVVETVQEYFEKFAGSLPRLYAAALFMDREWFGGKKKPLAGRGRGETFFTEYDPAKVIKEGFGLILPEFGPGLGRFEDHIELMQTLGAEAIALESVMEKNPHIRSVATERRRIILQKLDELIYSDALRGQAAVPLEWLAQARVAIAEGADPARWFLENRPPQATATPEGTPPLPPGVAAAAMPPGEAPVVRPPPLEQLLGIR